ncbi:hypothetical protein [Emticicia sp. BO119]|uniref:hypothetical protein n=1 Tax=Emticicia sp. BO119 TaxID=2757768 RepID=UPI0015F0B2A4|nr:hypothetical protein [Emticicia sp. BO119]MBA4849247.1 hypothetical protein [Emticicia sp. BO119]
MSKTLILTGILIIVFFLANTIGLDHLLHPQKWVILSFFVAYSFLFNRLIEMGFKEKSKNFIPFYLASVAFRLILSIIFIGIELYMGLQQQELFIANFFVLYLFYTIFEIWNLNSNLRQNSEK